MLAPLTEKIFDSTKEASHRWPVFLPDGKHSCSLPESFTNASDDRSSGIYLSSLTGKEKKLLVLTHLEPGICKRLLVLSWMIRRSLRATALDRGQRKRCPASRKSSPIRSVIQPSTYWGAFSVAENGTVVYNPTVGAALLGPDLV